MGGIALSASVRQNLLSLQNTADMMSQTSSRLSTGKKVNSALDNPQSFFTAQGLSNRASDLTALQDSTKLAVQTLKSADQGLTSIQKLVDQAKSTANQALQAKATATTLTSSSVTAHDFSTSAGTNEALDIIVGGATAATVTISANIADAGDLKTVLDTAGVTGLSVTDNGDGTLGFSLASGEDLSFGAAAATSLGVNSDSSTNGETLTEARSTYVTDYNNLRTQIDQLATDASFNGVNLLNGDNLSVKFNEDGSSKLDITGVSYNSTGLGINTADFSTDAKVATAVSELNSATNTLRAQSSTFGGNLSVVQNRQDFTKNLISILDSGAGDLTLADTNEEGANMLALQTRQSLSTTSLSMANQADQAVLSFLR